ncbi:MAG TPA: sulfatase, partial [Acidimicrobiia bacterium]|nr:sulfatase [Acidimicrobiia bacterium]
MRILYLDVDTLRADHVGCYGYHRATTPNIDALAADGVRFANVYASDVPCLPSRTALITGAFGIRNGVVNHGGAAADLRSLGAEREFVSRWAWHSWAGLFYNAGWHTASLSSFPFRHSASWWNAGFMEAMNLMRGMGGERADHVLPGALDWLDRRGRNDRWFLHVHLWDPHTPYNTPADYGNPFASDPVSAWHTDAVRAHNWSLSGPHSAQEPWGFRPDEWGDPPPREPWDASSMDAVKQIFDGYDVGIRYADDALGTLCNKLADIGVLDDTAILVSTDHGEAFGELGVYADHQAADEATCHIPAVLRWPGLAPNVHDGLQYHLDVAATLVDLAGIKVPRRWDGVPIDIGG